MPDRIPADEDGYFGPLASARYMMLTTFKPDGRQMSVVVPGLIDGDRAYFQVWTRSGTLRNLLRSDEVQVAPCGALGFVVVAPPVGAIARPLRNEEASQVARKLARKYGTRERFIHSLLHRARRQKMVHYELLPCEFPADAAHDQHPHANEAGRITVTVLRDPGPFPRP
jgi:uncharacterized protein